MKRIAWVAALMATVWMSVWAMADEPVPDAEEASGYMDPDGSSPAAALNPAESGLEVWLGPIMMGVFAFFLILFIRRYSKSRHQGQAQQDLPPNQDERD